MYHMGVDGGWMGFGLILNSTKVQSVRYTLLSYTHVVDTYISYHFTSESNLKLNYKTACLSLNVHQLFQSKYDFMSTYQNKANIDTLILIKNVINVKNELPN